MTGRIVAVTGTTGFVGRALVAGLARRGWRVRALLRRPGEVPADVAGVVIGDLSAPRHLSEALAGAEAVIHSAGIAHAMSGRPEDDYRSINTEGTLALARAARRAGMRRFLFLSSVRAQCGPSSPAPVREADEPAPTDPYGRSKLAAEQGLAELDLDWAALRPVLVHGPWVKGNMAGLMAMADTPWPLPLGGFTGRRSLVAVENLVDAAAFLLDAPGPLRRPYLVADPGPMTVGEIVVALRRGMGRPPRVVPVPAALMGAALRLAGRGEWVERLNGSLVAMPEGLLSAGWRPPVQGPDALEALGRAHRRPGA